jgi:hypothetical protein
MVPVLVLGRYSGCRENGGWFLALTFFQVTVRGISPDWYWKNIPKFIYRVNPTTSLDGKGYKITRPGFLQPGEWGGEC